MAGVVEDKILIIEFGTYSIKLKVGTDDVGSLPNLEIRSQIGIPEDILSPPGSDEKDTARSSRISDSDLQKAFKEGKLFIGSELSKYFSTVTTETAKPPIKLYDTLGEDGVIDWVSLRLLLIHVLVRELEIALDDNDSALLVAVPLGWPKIDLEKLTQLCFESLNSPALYILPQPLGTLYGYGLGSGLVIDIGYSSTKLTPIIESCIINYGHSTVDFGTKDFDGLLLDHILNQSEIKEAFSGVKLDIELVQYLREDGHFNFSKKAEVSVEEAGRVSPKGSVDKTKAEYNGTTVEIDEDLLNVNQFIFPRENMSKEAQLSQQLIDCIFRVVERCEPEKRNLLWENIVLSGGFSCAKGLRKSLEQALQARLPTSENSGLIQASTVKVVAMPEYFSKWKVNPHLSTMLGSTITAKFVFQEPKLHITKLDYSESGPLIIHNKSA